jgi:hypothetical protein
MAKSLNDLSTKFDPAELLAPVENYALQTLPEAFENFDEVVLPLLHGVKQIDTYDVTVFYSRRKGISTEQHESLAAHNQSAFDAAKKAEGLILYYQGHLLIDPVKADMSPRLQLDFVPDCLSFCIWESLDLAKAGSSVTEHRAAVSRVNEWYEGFAIKKYHLKVQQEQKNGKTYEKIVLEEYRRPAPTAQKLVVQTYRKA